MRKRQARTLRTIYKNSKFWIWEIFLFLLAVIICAIGLILLNFTAHKYIGKLFGLTSYYIFLTLPVMFAAYLLIKIFQLIKKGFINMHDYTGYDEEFVFKFIDKYKLGDNKNIQYLLCIKKINEIYASDVILGYIEKKRIKIFYERKQFLKKHSKLFYDAKDFMRTVLISFSSVFLSQVIVTDSETMGFAAVISYSALLLIIFVALILPYLEKELFGDLLYEIDEYEMEKINFCIQQIETNTLKDNEYKIEQMAFETKCTLFEDAKSNRRKKEQKEISQWVLVPSEGMLEENCTSIHAIVDCGKIPSSIYFVIRNEGFREACASFGHINRQQLKEFLISSDYKRCFEYVEKYLGTNIFFPDNEVNWNEEG